MPVSRNWASNVQKTGNKNHNPDQLFQPKTKKSMHKMPFHKLTIKKGK